jgi:hypothetical protein
LQSALLFKMGFTGRSSIAQGGDQVAELGIDVLWVFDRLGYHGAEGLTVALAKAVKGHA